jgi:hypothetical protein
MRHYLEHMFPTFTPTPPAPPKASPPSRVTGVTSPGATGSASLGSVLFSTRNSVSHATQNWMAPIHPLSAAAPIHSAPTPLAGALRVPPPLNKHGSLANLHVAVVEEEDPDPDCLWSLEIEPIPPGEDAKCVETWIVQRVQVNACVSWIFVLLSTDSRVLYLTALID